MYIFFHLGQIKEILIKGQKYSIDFILKTSSTDKTEDNSERYFYRQDNYYWRKLIELKLKKPLLHYQT